MHFSTPLLPLVLLTSSTTLAFRVTPHTKTGCREGKTSNSILRPETGCQKTDKAISHQLTGDGSDNSLYVVYFTDENCDPDQVAKKMDVVNSSGSACVDWSNAGAGYKSFEVWDMCTGGEKCLG
jgi:hypothetical protein